MMMLCVLALSWGKITEQGTTGLLNMFLQELLILIDTEFNFFWALPGLTGSADSMLTKLSGDEW